MYLCALHVSLPCVDKIGSEYLNLFFAKQRKQRKERKTFEEKNLSFLSIEDQTSDTGASNFFCYEQERRNVKNLGGDKPILLA